MCEKLDGLSMDLENANMEKLKSVFPECFSEGIFDIDKLLSLCGEYIDNDFEKYKFEWKGKSECLRLAQKRSTGTLRPCKEKSVNFDDTQNVYIEGDNLEVLKLLQTAYFNKIKMIYIDPPYNTGNDFVYEDDFADPMARYKEVTQQTTKSNPETMGRYHTNWLNMMYPRLRLAANLLTDDGVIFISIDDNEVTNLRKICDEVFGEENFVAQIVWEKRFTRSNNAKMFASLTDYILVYRKSEAVNYLRTPRTEKSDSIYSNPDNDARGAWTSVSYVNPATKEQRPNLVYTIKNPITGDEINHPTNAWKYEDKKYIESIYSGKLIFNTRKVISPLEIDIYIPDKNLAIECNGTFWHSSLNNCDENYHYNKSIKCQKLGIKLIHIYEYEWYTNQNKIKQLLNISLNNFSKIFARQCKIRVITDNIAKIFNENNNLQGHKQAQITYGLFYQNTLIQIMSFSRINVNQNNLYNTEWEIVRECSISNTVVIGGISKLFKYFIKIFKPSKIISYCDFNKFNGKSLEILGMSCVSYTGPNKWWIVGNDLVSKKPKNNTARGILWDAGNKKYEIKFE